MGEGSLWRRKLNLDLDIYCEVDLDPLWLDLTVRESLTDVQVLVLMMIRQAIIDLYYEEGHLFKESALEFLFSSDMEVFCKFLGVEAAELRRRLWTL